MTARSESKQVQSCPSWRFSRQLTVSAVVELVLLAGLIVGSYVNLQRQLALLQRDVSVLLQWQQRLEQRLEQLRGQAVAHEYRLRALEGRFGPVEPGEERF